MSTEEVVVKFYDAICEYGRPGRLGKTFQTKIVFRGITLNVYLIRQKLAFLWAGITFFVPRSMQPERRYRSRSTK